MNILMNLSNSRLIVGSYFNVLAFLTIFISAVSPGGMKYLIIIKSRVIFSCYCIGFLLI